jgi:hypothetical protein
MNLPRLRELLKAWQDGSIREAELLELRDALPEVLAHHDDMLRTARSIVDEFDRMPRLPTNQDCGRSIFKMAPYFAQLAAAVDRAD